MAGAVRTDVAPANVHDPHETLERRRQHQVTAPTEPGETRDSAADSYRVPRNLYSKIGTRVNRFYTRVPAALVQVIEM